MFLKFASCIFRNAHFSFCKNAYLLNTIEYKNEPVGVNECVRKLLDADA